MSRFSARWRDIVISLLLALAVTLIYAQTARHQFVNLDDDEYVYDNPHLRAGLTPAAVAWSLTAFYAANWHPLTWLSHALDIQLYHFWAPGHHITAVVLHVAVTIALYFLLKRLTLPPWPAALAAAFFAVHPLRVESVAWVAERKDLLSGLFFVLTLHAWLGYVRRPRPSAYAAALVLYALGLLCKPMLVSLPLVLLLLDYWPLGRVAGGRSKASDGSVRSDRSVRLPAPASTNLKSPASTGHRPPTTRLLLEKLPFFLLAAVSSLITMSAQKEALSSIPLAYRATNAVVTTAAYLGQTLWPSRLSPFYPFLPGGPPLVQVLIATIVLLAISAAAVALRRSHPYFIVGWLWYLVMLLPVVGLVQVGDQSGADRYTYLPLLGPTWAVMAWWSVAGGGSNASDGSVRSVRSPASGKLKSQISIPSSPSLPALSAVLLAALTVAAWGQTSFWLSGETLWNHAVMVTRENTFALNNLGTALIGAEQDNAALLPLQRAVAFDYHRGEPHANLGGVLFRKGEMQEAITHLTLALKFDPQRIDPIEKVHFYLAQALEATNRPEEAVAEYRRTIEINPSNAEAHYHLGMLLARSHQLDEAVAQLRQTAALQPANTGAHNALAALLAGQGKIGEALPHFRKAVDLDPKNSIARANLGRMLSRLGRQTEAIAQLRVAADLDPRQPQIATWLAWSLATAPDAADRNGAEALRYAEKAVAATQAHDPAALDALAAAQAEQRNYPAAQQTAQQAQRLAASQNSQQLAAEIAQRIELYRAKKPYRSR